MSFNEYRDLFVKLILAFLIPFGWASILYPLKKKTKSWYILLILASILSFFILIIKEVMDGLYSLFDEIITYALGVFFAISLVSFFLHFKHRLFPRSSPIKPATEKVFKKKDIFFHRNKFNKHLHLRYLIQVAILIEGQGKEFYDRFAEKVTHESVKSLCHKLAQEELNHREFFRGILSTLLPLPIDKEYLDSFIHDLNMRGVFLNPPSQDITEEDLAKYAIDQEKRVADFYLFFENVFTEKWKKVHIQTIIMEERAHANKLILAYPQFEYLRF